MCLTIPAQITEITGSIATIRDYNSTKKINISSLPQAKPQDWILYATDVAIKIISSEEAFEIIDLLETQHPIIPESELSNQYKEIITASHFRKLEKNEIEFLLNLTGSEEQALYAEADVIRKTNLKDFICIHGIIEFSNYCQNDCAYCGINKNCTETRYRMTPQEIINSAVNAVNNKGYKLLVLQSGEDPYFTDEIIENILVEIKKAAQVFIFLSIGERPLESYLKFKKAGASGVLLRFETSNQDLFNQFHGNGKSLTNRLNLLKELKQNGYFIATGSLVGLPGQTMADLADDILQIDKLANMASFGPFIPSANTSLSEATPGDPNLILKIIAILRLISRSARIPVVTALETLGGSTIRKQALLAGANALMFNLTPAKYRQLYKIYPNKYFEEDTLWEKYGLYKSEKSYEMLSERLEEELNK